MNIPFPGFPNTLVISSAKFPDGLFGGTDTSITLHSGLTTFLGANGSGKTRLLKEIRTQLKSIYGSDFVRFVSAGRMGVLEQFRSNTAGTGENNPNDAHIGNYNWMSSRKQAESVIGDFTALFAKADLRLKVEARLQGLFNRTIHLGWTQNGLKIDFQSLDANATRYGAGNEASGLTQLVAMLAAIYDDDIRFLLIDEPEVSLHPQLQAFLLEEILQVAGDPNQPGKKCIIMSTHSPAMLELKKIQELPGVIFFNDPKQTPKQIDPTHGILTDPLLQNLITRLGEGYKIAFFARSVLLSEGVSDEIIINSIANLKRAHFASTGVQVLPISGKGELKLADELFQSIGKSTCMIGDLDILDDSVVARYMDAKKNATAASQHFGFNNLEHQVDDLNANLLMAINSNWPDISHSAASQGYWTTTNDLILKQRRSILSFLASSTIAQVGALNNAAVWVSLKTQLESILQIMDTHGMILIRKGSIEDCYINPQKGNPGKKPQKASIEANYLVQNNPPLLDTAYDDVLKAINFVRRPSEVNEAALIREKLGSIIGAIEANYTDSTDDEQIQRIIAKLDPDIAQIFEITKTLIAGSAGLEIKITSSLFSSYQNVIQYKFGEGLHLLKDKLN